MNTYNPSRELLHRRAAVVTKVLIYKEQSKSPQNQSTPRCSIAIPLDCRFVLEIRGIDVYVSVRAILAISQLVSKRGITPRTIPLSVSKTYSILPFEVRFANTVVIQEMKCNEVNLKRTYETQDLI